jgi:tetratricopeptide (TPR) repeat protein
MPYTPMQLAEAFIQTGELQDALDALDQQLDTHPDDDDARRLRIKVVMRMPDPVSLTPLLSELDKLSALTADDYVQKSVIMQQLSRYKESSSALGQAHMLKPDDLRITENLVRAFIRSEDFDSAKMVLADLPRTWGWLRYAGEIAGKQGDYQSALKFYDEAIDDLDRKLKASDNPILVDNKIGFMSMRAICYSRLNQFDKAEAEYAEMERLEPRVPYNRLWRGLVIARSGDTERAVPVVWAAMNESGDMYDYAMESMAEEAGLNSLAQAIRERIRNA